MRRYVAFIAVLVAITLPAVAAAQYGYQAEAFELGTLITTQSIGSYDSGACDFDALSVRCRAQFSGNGAWWLVVDRDINIASAAGLAVDMWYRTSSASDWRVTTNSFTHWIIPSASVGQHITLCAYDDAKLANVAVLAGIHCDYSLANSGTSNPLNDLAIGVGSQGSSGTIEATFYNFRHIIPGTVPTPAPPITSTTHTIELPSGDVASVPMTATAGDIFVAAGVALLIGLALFEHLRRMAQGARAR